ncbi:MAG: hypothetical protein KDC38_00520 [Planctomycetes bacterium]|nr:hypothetical protein [Planctomycetota bacterium]
MRWTSMVWIGCLALGGCNSGGSAPPALPETAAVSGPSSSLTVMPIRVLDTGIFDEDVHPAPGDYRFAQQDTWDYFWTTFIDDAPPIVDFSQEMVIGLVRFAPGEGSSVTTTEITFDSSTHEILVDYVYYDQCDWSGPVTYPYDFVTVPITLGTLATRETIDGCMIAVLEDFPH